MGTLSGVKDSEHKLPPCVHIVTVDSQSVHDTPPVQYEVLRKP